jgi:hypothetical protein
MKCLYQYICRATAGRVDHAQLTTKMIMDIIHEDVEKDQTITIKQVHVLIRKTYQGVNPKYDKLWRWKEIVVSYIYGSWSIPTFECNYFIKLTKHGSNHIRSTTTTWCTSIQICGVGFGFVHRSILQFTASHQQRCITPSWEI